MLTGYTAVWHDQIEMADKVSHKDISVCNESLHLYTANYIFMQILCKKSCIQVYQIITSLLG